MCFIEGWKISSKQRQRSSIGDYGYSSGERCSFQLSLIPASASVRTTKWLRSRLCLRAKEDWLGN